jgi:hypothetical protein
MWSRRNLVLWCAVLAVMGLVLLAGSNRSNAWKVREAKFTQQIAACLKHEPPKLLASASKDFSITKGLLKFRIGEVANAHGAEDSGQVQHLDFSGYVKFIATSMLQDTPYAGHLTVNTEPDPNSINIYFLDCDLSATVRGFPNSNCTYVGYVNSIVCRAKAIEDEFALLDHIPRAYDVAIIDARTHVPLGPDSATLLSLARKMLKQSMITWMIGHEIGHAVKHKEVVAGSQQPLHFNLFYNEIEREADDFVADRLARSETLLASSQSGTGISEFIHQQYRILLKQQLPAFDEILLSVRDLPTVVPLEITVGAGNYPLLLRAIGVRQAIATAKVYADDTNYPAIVANNVIAHSAEPPTHLKLAIGAGTALLLLGALAGSLFLDRHKSPPMNTPGHNQMGAKDA